MAKRDTETPEQPVEKEAPPVDFKTANRKASKVADTVGESRDMEDVRHLVDILGVALLITGFKRLNGDNGEYLFVYAFEVETQKEFGFCCGGAVVMEKLSMIKDSDKLPVNCVIEKVKDKYYDIK